MARHNAAVVRGLGHQIDTVCTTGDSDRRRRFMDDFQVGRACDRVEDLLAMDRNVVEALLVATPWDRTADIAEQVLEAGIPSLIEKPPALSSRRLREWLERPTPLGERTLIGHNRRFYEFLPEVRQALSTRTLLSVEGSFPDPLDADFASAPAWVPTMGLLSRTSHPLDLLLHLLGDLRVEQMHRTGRRDDGGFAAYNGLLVATATDVPVHLRINFDAPSRHRLALHFSDRIYELSPLETLTVYHGMDVADPTPEHPIRRYSPQVEISRKADLAYKPGLRGQLEEFIASCVHGKPRGVGCTLADTERVTRLCEAIVGSN